MRRIRYIPLLVAAAGLTLSLTFALPLIKAPLSAAVSLDTVDIQLSCEDANQTSEIFGDQVITRVDTVINKGSDCWIRVGNYLTWDNASGLSQHALVSGGTIQDTGWVRGVDGWLYALNPLKDGESITFTEAVFNPEGSDWDGRRINLLSTIEVQAVQYRNVTPDFTSETPWGSITPEACVRQRDNKEQSND